MNAAEVAGMSVTESVVPNSPVVEALQAIVRTVDEPSISVILADIELAYVLVNQFKKDMQGLHPSVANIIKALF
jgi:hypothetical protein